MCLATAWLLTALLLVPGHWVWLPASLDGPLGDAGWTARSRAWLVPDGVYSPELERGTRHRFSWTAETAHLRVPKLDRSRTYTLGLDVRGPRPPGQAPSPALRVYVDGVRVGSHDTSNDPQRVVVSLPQRRAHGALVTLQVSNTFVPGPHDRRQLGVQVTGVSLAPDSGRLRPSGRVAATTAAAVVLAVGGVLLCGLGFPLAIAASASLALAFSWLALHDGAFLGGYADRLVAIGVGMALAGAVVGLARRTRPGGGGCGSPGLSVAAGVSLAGLAVKLAVFAHPRVNIGDAIFHVHRAEWVQSGRYFFTSVTPSPFFEFPYPIGLYLAALPFWDHFPTKLDVTFLLRSLTLGADALVGLGLFLVARRQWSGAAGLVAVVLWLFSPGPFRGLCNANLTNVFAQSFFGLAMIGVALNASAVRVSASLVLATATALAVAFLSHFGAVMVGIPLVVTASVALVAGGQATARRAGLWALAACLAAVTVSYGAYYSRFHDEFGATFQRLWSGEATAGDGRSLRAPIAEKFTRWIAGTSDDYGLPGVALLVTAAAGAALLYRQRPREGLTIILAVWAGLWAGLAALGVVSAVQVRVNLAAAPLFVLLAAYALTWLASRSTPGAALAIVAGLAAVQGGLREWFKCVGL